MFLPHPKWLVQVTPWCIQAPQPFSPLWVSSAAFCRWLRWSAFTSLFKNDLCSCGYKSSHLCWDPLLVRRCWGWDFGDHWPTFLHYRSESLDLRQRCPRPIVTAVPWVTTVVWVRSLAWELLHAEDVAKKKKKKKKEKKRRKERLKKRKERKKPSSASPDLFSSSWAGLVSLEALVLLSLKKFK